MKKAKIIISILIVTVITSMISNVSLQAEMRAKQGKGTVKIQNSIAYISGGKAPYTENGVTYYYPGNVIELTVAIPPNTRAIGVHEILTYNANQLELISSFQEIKRSLGEVFYSERWVMDTDYWQGNKNQISLRPVTENWTKYHNVSGGVIAKIRFRIKEQALSANAQNINISFRCQMVGVDQTGSNLIYIHDGYDPNNDAGTFMTSPPSVVVPAYKLPVTSAPPSAESGKNPTHKEDGKGTSTWNYSFKNTGIFVNGKDTYLEIAKALIEKTPEEEKISKYQIYEFEKQTPDANNKVIVSNSKCYKHYLYIAAGFVAIFITYGYKKYLEANQKKGGGINS